jgi:hypothetical protein
MKELREIYNKIITTNGDASVSSSLVDHLSNIDPVDRGKSAPNNLLCYVVEQKHDKFKLACSGGILERYYPYNSFRKTVLTTNFSLECVPKKDPNNKPTKSNPDTNRYYKIGEVEYIELGIREAMKSVSVGLGQGFVRCNCSGKCANRRCGCFESKIGCNTKCHPKTTKKCENVKDILEEIEEESCEEDLEEE